MASHHVCNILLVRSKLVTFEGQPTLKWKKGYYTGCYRDHGSHIKVSPTNQPKEEISKQITVLGIKGVVT